MPVTDRQSSQPMDNQVIIGQPLYPCWWYTYRSEKYESQLELLFRIGGPIKNVPNHQPDPCSISICGWLNHVESPIFCFEKSVEDPIAEAAFLYQIHGLHLAGVAQLSSLRWIQF